MHGVTQPSAGTRPASASTQADGPAAIGDYALIGDCHGAALVSTDGAIDWACLERFDAPAVFCRLLSARRGGTLQVAVSGASDRRRRYLPDTNVLETTLTGRQGALRITDFMPVWRTPRASTHDYVSLEAPGWIVRTLTAVDAAQEVVVRCRLTPDFAAAPPALTLADGVLRAGTDGPAVYGDLPWHLEGDTAEARLTLEAGASASLVVTPSRPAAPPTPADLDAMRARTVAFWREWASYIRYAGPYAPAVTRSALVLKALTFAPTGALVAAPTTSLPEHLGGERNWDYRYCWLRDGTFLLYALSMLGFSGECRRFADYLSEVGGQDGQRLQIMYGIGHERVLAEQTLPHLDGYAGSQPVRVGNAAYEQVQLDVYGEVLDWALLHWRLGGRFDERTHSMLRATADQVAACWAEPESGIWEERSAPRHHVFGKVMAWVALDRAARLFGDTATWHAARTEIVRAVHARGLHPEHGLRQTFDGDAVDASLLLVPMVGFPIDDAQMRQTIATIRARLEVGGLLRRYDGDDGLDGDEGAFVVCTLWLADALLATGEVDEGVRVYEAVVARGNDVGLFAEEIDAVTGAFLGNHPQALTHLAVVQGAVHIEMVRRGGPEALRGAAADRAARLVGATFGLRGLLAAFRQSGRVGRIWSSRASRRTGRR